MALEVDGSHTKNVHDFPRTKNGGEDELGTDDNGGFKPEVSLFASRDGKVPSVEELFAATEVPPWWAQITIRGMFVSLLLGVLFSIITLKLSLTTGIIPSLNVSAGLLGFFFTRSITAVLSKLGISHRPFTRQENTVIQTCVVACYGLAFSGGYGSYLIGMDQRTYHNVNSASDSPNEVKNPQLGWIFAYMFAVGFLGLVAVVPLRKVMIIDFKLTYPSGTATAVLINSFHTPQGSKVAMKQIASLGKYFSFSFLFSFFKWFFSGLQDSCGFDSFPSLGLAAFTNSFYFNFSMTYVGAGMICPHLINVSLLLGGILSWGIMWPLISNKKGEWYPVEAVTDKNLRGLYGYKVFVAIALILGDGLYNFVKITVISVWTLHQSRKKTPLPTNNQEVVEDLSPDEERRNALFMKDRIPFKLAAALYVSLAAISIGVIPQIFHQMKWYYVFLSYCVAPVLGFCNSYGCGLTDWSLASTYGKLGLFIFSAWAGRDGGVIVGLASCGVMMIVVSCSADLMQDFKTGYLTLSSPRSMFLSQVIGTAMGCIIAPLSFWLYWNAFPIGDLNGEYKAPFATVYREMTLIGVEGFGALPKHCLQLSFAFFCLAILVNFLRDKPLAKWADYIPIPMAMAIPFYIGTYFAIDMFVGTVIVYVMQRVNRRKADILVPAIASGLICGDGVWTLIAAILALAKKNAPICMMFLSSNVAANLPTSS